MDEKHNIRSWIKFKASEIVIQMVVVVISIILALAVDEWRDERKQQELANRSERSILEELKANQQELDVSLAINDSIFRSIVVVLQNKTEHKGGVPFSYAQLSTAAWKMAQGTQALYRIDFNRLLLFARVYELQTLYGTHQSKLLENLGQSWDQNKEAMQRIKRKLVFELATVNEVGKALVKQYCEALMDSISVKK